MARRNPVKLLGWYGLTLMLLSGCPPYQDPSVPGEVLRDLEPERQNPYYVYVPSNYDAQYKWPLIVLCHGTRPWDTAQRQMADWVRLAEEKGFVVAAPELAGTSAIPEPAAEEQIVRQRADERTILSTVQAIRGAYSISPDRIFLTGWSAGNFAVLYTGLRNPETFRALAVMQGNFVSAYLTDLSGKTDPHQPVAVVYSPTDPLLGKGPEMCLEWLDGQNADVVEVEVSGGHRNHPRLTQEFFERVIRQMPWLILRSYPAPEANPLAVQFKTTSSFEPTSFSWSFGDGEESPVAEPVHQFAAPGTYRVTLSVTITMKKRLDREMTLTVPLMAELPPRRTTWDE